MLRAIYAFHRYVNGWNDIGYNFVLDRFGRIFEARAGGIDEPVVGAQAGGYNLVSTGVAVLGSFMPRADLPARPDGARSACSPGSSRCTAFPRRGRVTVRVNPAGAVYSRFPAARARVAAAHRRPSRRGHHDCPGDRPTSELLTIRPSLRRPRPRRVRDARR